LKNFKVIIGCVLGKLNLLVRIRITTRMIVTFLVLPATPTK
jgi:hypothetical protein